MANLNKMNPGEFARRLRVDSEKRDKRFGFFLGAGCSISSGIPGTSSLVRDVWIPRLREICAPDHKDLDEWAKLEFPKYDPDDPGASYGSVIKRLFISPQDRQEEIERLCDGKFPGFGYAVLSTLVAQEGGKFNVVVTTNFDDLVSDALYLFTRARPLVIGHESLAGFIRPTRTRPLVVKIHGDFRLSPQNTAAETANIQKEVERQVKLLLNDRALVFMGYGGNDEGITRMLSDLPREALPYGVYWVSGSKPKGVIRTWLEARDAVWVEHFDFDEMMLLIRDAFDLPHPDMKQVESIFQLYASTYEKLSGRILSTLGKSDDALRKAVDRADNDLTGWASYILRADRIKRKDPHEAERIYIEGLERYPESSPLLSGYARFLEHINQDYDRAKQFYELAIKADPKDANILGNYAVFLRKRRKDFKEAEHFFHLAVEVDPYHANNLNNYAIFLKNDRHDYDQAEQFFKRAIDADPNHPPILGNFANFLYQIRKEFDIAEQLYQRGLEVEPNNEFILSSYATFLYKIRKNNVKAEQYYRRALEVDPSYANNLGNYAGFTLSLGIEEGHNLLDKAISLLPFPQNPGLVARLKSKST
jgi:Tfp pilus assembly protein PilF